MIINENNAFISHAKARSPWELDSFEMERLNQKKIPDSSDADRQPPLRRIHCPIDKHSKDLLSDSSSDDDARPSSRDRNKGVSPARCPDFGSDSAAATKKIAQQWEYYTCPFKPGNPFRTVESDEVHALMHIMHSNEDVSDSDEPQDAPTHHDPSDAVLDDLSYFQFSELQLKLKSPMTSPELVENKFGAVNTGRISPTNSSRKPEILSSELAHSQFLVNGDQGDYRESFSVSKFLDSEPRPTVLSPARFSVDQSQSTSTASSQNLQAADQCHLPVRLEEGHQLLTDSQIKDRYQPERLFHHATAEPHTLGNTSGQFKPSHFREWVAPSPDYNQVVCQSHQVPQITVQPAHSSTQLEPIKLGQTISANHSPLTLRETAPPSELILQPMALPHIVMSQPGPSVSAVSKSGLPHADWKESLYLASSSQTDPSLLPPPPSYSECMRQEMLKSKYTPFLGGRKAHFKQQVQDQSQYALVDVGARDSFCQLTLGPTKNFRKVPGLCNICDRTHFAQAHLDRSSRSDDMESLALRGRQRWDTPPADHQLLAFISCLFCWPIGLVAIYYSNKSHMLKSEGDYEQARTYARLAFIISVIGLCSGSFAYLIMLIYEKSM